MYNTLLAPPYQTQTREIVTQIITTTGELLDIYEHVDSGLIITRQTVSQVGIYHPGIIIGVDMYDRIWVAHNHYKNRKPMFETLEAYQANQELLIDNRPRYYSEQELVQRAVSEIIKGKMYLPVGYNCQTFVNVIASDNHSSETITKASNYMMGGGAIVGLIGLLTKNKTLTGIGAGALLLGGAANVYSKYTRGK